MTRKTTWAMFLAIATSASPALACSPSPSCWQRWQTSHPTTLKSTCHGYFMNGDTVRQIAAELKDAKKAALLAQVCRRLGSPLPD